MPETESVQSATGGGGSEDKVAISLDGKPLDLTLLLKVVQTSGKPLPVGSFTARAVAEKVRKLTRFNPIEVEVVSRQDVVLDFDRKVPVIEVAQKMHGPTQWDGMGTNISCLMSMKKSVLSIVNDQEEGRNLQRELQEQRRSKEEENKYV